VEFVAVIARIFKDYRVAPKLMMDECETLSQAQARVKRGVEDSVIKVTLNMKKPEDIRLVWKKKA
jgi:hypothetical protein